MVRIITARKSVITLTRKQLTGQVAPDTPAAVVAGYLKSDIPRKASFETLSDAREELPSLVLAQYAVVYMDDVEREQCRRSLEHWSERFDRLVASKPIDQLTRSEKRTTALLRLHRTSVTINLRNVTAGNGADARDVMIWDDFCDEYNTMVHDAAIALGLDEQDDLCLAEPAPAPAQPHFHLEFGILTAILTVIVKCRDPLIRRKALSLMLAAPSQEGIWSSVMLARVAQRLIALEEGGRDVRSSSDIPKCFRVTELLATVKPGDAHATIQFVFAHGTVEELIPW